MLNVVIGIVLAMAQLSGPAASLPQILTPEFESAAIKPGDAGEVTVSFDLLDGFAINRVPPVVLKLESVPDVTLEKTEFVSNSEDPKSEDEYYVDLPVLKVPVSAARAGTYEIPGQLVYFFCSKADGFCSRQVVEVKIPVVIR